MSSAALLLTLAYSLLAMGRIKVVHVVGMGPATGWTSPCKGVTFRKCTHVRAGRLLLRSPLSSGFCVLVLHHNMGVLSMQVGMSVPVWHIPPRGHNWRMLTTLLRDHLRLSALVAPRLCTAAGSEERQNLNETFPTLLRDTKPSLLRFVLQDWQNKCTKIFVNTDVVEEWSRIATAMNELGKGKSKGEEAAKEMMELLEAELKTVHDVMGKKWRCVLMLLVCGTVLIWS